MKFTTDPQTQIDIERLATALASLGPDDLLSYAEMARLVGYDIRERPWPMLRARDRVEKETGLRFGTVRAEGYCRLTADQLPGIGISARRRVGRIAKRTASRLTSLKSYNDIDRHLQALIDLERSLAGAIGTIAATKGDRAATITKTGPVVANAVFDYIRRTTGSGKA